MKIESAGWGSIGEEKKEKKREKKCCRWLATGQTQSEWWEGLCERAGGCECERGQKGRKCNYANFYPDKAKKLSTDEIIYLFNSLIIITQLKLKRERAKSERESRTKERRDAKLYSGNWLRSQNRKHSCIKF